MMRTHTLEYTASGACPTLGRNYTLNNIYKTLWLTSDNIELYPCVTLVLYVILLLLEKNACCAYQIYNTR